MVSYLVDNKFTLKVIYLKFKSSILNLIYLTIPCCFLHSDNMIFVYLIPIKIRAPLIFAHLACAKIKGSKFAQYECAKIKGRRENATNE